MKQYYLMNKDVPLLKFASDETPLGTNITETNKYSDKMPIGFTDIASWIENRNYAKHKTHFSKWLKEWGIDKTEGFIDVTHCLGINDTLWVKPTDSNLKWEQVSLYRNQFTDVAQKTAFDTGLFGLQLSPTQIMSPEFTSEGSAPKCWKKEENSIFLYKSKLKGAANYGLEANSEFISSVIARQIVGDASISYDLTEFQNTLCSKCKLFSSESLGYVPFYKFIDANKVYHLGDVLRICTQMGYEEECRRMLLLDSIVFNQDRHLGNFGFLVDNDTFEIKKFAPLFDYNQSLLCNAMADDIKDIDAFYEYEDRYKLGHKLGGRFEEVGKAIITDDLRDIIPDTVVFPKHGLYNLDDDRVNNLIHILKNNLRCITDRNINIIYSDYEHRTK